VLVTPCGNKADSPGPNSEREETLLSSVFDIEEWLAELLTVQFLGEIEKDE
jgi:hypothetical protein